MFRQVVPNSSINSANLDYEFCLVWLSPLGGVRQWLFSHTKGNTSDGFNNTVIETDDNIRSIPVMEQTMIKAQTVDLDLDTFNYVKSIMSSNRVYQVSKVGVKAPIALNSGSILKDNKLKSFGVAIQFMYKENDILNV